MDWCSLMWVSNFSATREASNLSCNLLGSSVLTLRLRLLASLEMRSIFSATSKARSVTMYRSSSRTKSATTTFMSRRSADSRIKREVTPWKNGSLYKTFESGTIQRDIELLSGNCAPGKQIDRARGLRRSVSAILPKESIPRHHPIMPLMVQWPQFHCHSVRSVPPYLCSGL